MAGRLRGWLSGRTLSTRLIAGLVALLFAACAAVGAVTYAGLRGSLLGQLDNQVAAASSRYVSCVNPPPAWADPPGSPYPGPGGQAGHLNNPGFCANTPGQAQATFSAAIRSGVFVAADVTNGTCHLSAQDEAMLEKLRTGGAPVTEQLCSPGTSYRLMAVRGADGTILVTGLPVSPVTATLHKVEFTEIIVFAAALILAGLLGTGWVRLSLRPLRRVTATAAQVAGLPLATEADLPHRVPDADSRTEVGQLGSAFNRMLTHVESAIARRHASEERLRTFAADASHELRTPLAVIRGYAELARRGRGTLPPETEHALDRVLAEADRMSSLVADLLLLARLDAGRPLESGPVDLTRLVIDGASDAQVAGPDHRWQLDLPEGPVVVAGDDQRLRQVLGNLLGNARVHTPAGTIVTVTLDASVPAAAGAPAGPDGAAGTAQLTVTDDGPGIPAELQAGVFERFVRGDSSRSHAAGSTGLGLSIVAAVVAAHHGLVAVTSRPGRTSFVITLPVPPARDAG
jgi:two-component system, OmpR family, sensor kinase